MFISAKYTTIHNNNKNLTQVSIPPGQDDLKKMIHQFILQPYFRTQRLYWRKWGWSRFRFVAVTVIVVVVYARITNRNFLLLHHHRYRCCISYNYRATVAACHDRSVRDVLLHHLADVRIMTLRYRLLLLLLL